MKPCSSHRGSSRLLHTGAVAWRPSVRTPTFRQQAGRQRLVVAALCVWRRRRACAPPRSVSVQPGRILAPPDDPPRRPPAAGVVGPGAWFLLRPSTSARVRKRSMVNDLDTPDRGPFITPVRNAAACRQLREVSGTLSLMTTYGYARVSTRTQDVTGQVEQLHAAGVDVVRTETGSGGAARRLCSQRGPWPSRRAGCCPQWRPCPARKHDTHQVGRAGLEPAPGRL